jgi:glucose/arabinose dehydrogenase
VSFRRRLILSWLCAGLLLAAFLLPIGAAAPREIPIEPLPPGVVIETVVPDAKNLVAMDFTPDGRLLYTERISNYANGSYLGYVRVVKNGQLQPAPAYMFSVLHEGERGLLGIAVDPNFVVNHSVWVYFTKKSTSGDCGTTVKNRVVRFVLNDDNTVDSEPEVAGCFPVNQPAPGIFVTIHNGGNLHFGPDGKLYISVGNSDDKNDAVDPAQDLGSPLGKLHRFNANVPLSTPGDNPFPGSSIYAYGLRNSFDFDFDPISGQIFATENGDACDDEINRLLPRGNYGWRPNYPCDDSAPDPQYNTLPPLTYWSPSIAPTGLTFYRGDLIPEWKNDLFMCAFKDGSTALHHFKLNAARTAIVAHTILSDTITHQKIACRTDVLTGPDGALYYSEGGGYYNGPIKRLSRTTSFILSTVSVNPAAVKSGEVFTYTIQIRHVGTVSNTFKMSALLSPSTTLKSLSAGLIEQPGGVYWSAVVSGIQSLTGTIAVTVTDPLTTPYLISVPFEISAPNTSVVSLSATTLVNGWPIFLPLIRR